ncbi:protein FAM8A1, partial [Asbolus verrucosus]
MMPNGEHYSSENTNLNSGNTPVYQNREEYLQKLKQWLDKARLWHGFCAGFPYYVNLQNQTENSGWSSIYPTRPVLNNNLRNQNDVPDPKIAMQMSVEILTLELLHRFIVCCYEIYWLRGGTCATPGKRYMGLMVIQVENIVPVPGRSDDIVRVNPCSPLGLQKAIIRAILKNVFLGVMLPMCFTLYIFRFNRTGYDAISNSLVVEYNPQVQFQPVQ